MITMMQNISYQSQSWCSKQSISFCDSKFMSYRHISGAHPG